MLTDHAADLLPRTRPRSPWPTSRAKGSPTASVLVGDVMTDVLLQVRDARRSSTASLAGTRPRARRFPRRDASIAPRTPTTPRVSPRSSQRCRRSSDPVILLAHPRLSREGRRARHRAHSGLARRAPTARLPRSLAAVMTQRGGRDRLGRPAEGGVPAAGPVHDGAAPRPSGSRRSSSAGTCSRTPLKRRRGQPPRPAPTDAAPYGDGRAAERVIAELLHRLARLTRVESARARLASDVSGRRRPESRGERAGFGRDVAGFPRR